MTIRPSSKIEIERLQVKSCAASTRIYNYLRGKLQTIPSRKGIKKALSSNQITLNGSVAKSGDFVKEGDEILVFEKQTIPHKQFDLDLNVVHEDEELSIVEKPAGIPVSGNTFKTLQNALQHHIGISKANDYLPGPLPVHRLDSPTTGLVIVAKTYSARIALGELFEQRKIIKTYQAIVQGKLEGHGILNSPIEEKEAVTYYRSLAVYPSVKNEWISLLELSPETGRKHQLRIHLSRLGFPIIGDKQYGMKGNTLQHKGLFLAAVGLSFIHPKTKEELGFEIEAPNKFNRFLKREEKWVRRVKS